MDNIYQDGRTPQTEHSDKFVKLQPVNISGRGMCGSKRTHRYICNFGKEGNYSNQKIRGNFSNIATMVTKVTAATI